jgi:hypothetical protein
MFTPSIPHYPTHGSVGRAAPVTEVAAAARA